jgi:hypothetical protein
MPFVPVPVRSPRTVPLCKIVLRRSRYCFIQSQFKLRKPTTLIRKRTCAQKTSRFVGALEQQPKLLLNCRAPTQAGASRGIASCPGAVKQETVERKYPNTQRLKHPNTQIPNHPSSNRKLTHGWVFGYLGPWLFQPLILHQPP